MWKSFLSITFVNCFIAVAFSNTHDNQKNEASPPTSNSHSHHAKVAYKRPREDENAQLDRYHEGLSGSIPTITTAATTTTTVTDQAEYLAAVARGEEILAKYERLGVIKKWDGWIDYSRMGEDGCKKFICFILQFFEMQDYSGYTFNEVVKYINGIFSHPLNKEEKERIKDILSLLVQIEILKQRGDKYFLEQDITVGFVLRRGSITRLLFTLILAQFDTCQCYIRFDELFKKVQKLRPNVLRSEKDVEEIMVLFDQLNLVTTIGRYYDDGDLDNSGSVYVCSRFLETTESAQSASVEPESLEKDVVLPTLPSSEIPEYISGQGEIYSGDADEGYLSPPLLELPSQMFLPSQVPECISGQGEIYGVNSNVAYLSPPLLALPGQIFPPRDASEGILAAEEICGGNADVTCLSPPLLELSRQACTEEKEKNITVEEAEQLFEKTVDAIINNGSEWFQIEAPDRYCAINCSFSYYHILAYFVHCNNKNVKKNLLVRYFLAHKVKNVDNSTVDRYLRVLQKLDIIAFNGAKRSYVLKNEITPTFFLRSNKLIREIFARVFMNHPKLLKISEVYNHISSIFGAQFESRDFREIILMLAKFGLVQKRGQYIALGAAQYL